MIQALIVDDHAIVRAGIKQILTETHDISVVGEAENVPSMFTVLERRPVDIVLLDIMLPGRSGLDALLDLRRRFPRIHAIVLSAHPEEQFAVRALKSGAAGYIVKDRDTKEILNAIRKVAAGGKYISSTLAETLANQITEDDERPHERLSAREYEVMLKIAQGKTVKDVADDLGVSVKTVSTYRARILEKMKMSRNAELVQYAVRQGLVT